jgi:two-component system KDP operon response regulator KdpE
MPNSPRGKAPAVKLLELRRAGSNLRGDRQVALLLSSLPLPLTETAIPTTGDGARREYPEVEIVAISRGCREADCIAILETPYLPRPFRAQDLAARVRVAELRRFKAAGRSRFYRRGRVVIDLFDRCVALDGELIALAFFPLALLMLLAGRPGHLATFGDILALLGRTETECARRVLCNSVFRLRRKIERDPRRPELLLTEAGVGYRLAPETGTQSSPDACMTESRDAGDRPN